jgi:hypothetical protein
MDEHDIRLDKARRQVAEAELRVLRQKALVDDTRRLGRSTEKAEQLLAVLETSLDAMRDNLKVRTECLLHVRLAKWFRTLRR